MIKTRKKNELITKTCLAVGLLFLVLFGAKLALAIDRFQVGEAVTIGDFIYDDDYVATTTDCYLSVGKPDPSTELIVDNQKMNASTTGWHFYTFTPDPIVGVWSAAITCGTEGVDLAIEDKSFYLFSDNSSTTIAMAVWNNATRSLSTSTLSSGGALATEAYIDIATTTIINSTTGNYDKLVVLINNASSSLAINIPSSINPTITNASSSLYALLSGLMTTNTETITGEITNASSSLAINIANSQFALDTTIGNASTSLYSTLNASIVNASSSLSSLIGAITFDTSNLATVGSVTDLSEQLTAASTSLAIAIPSAINPTITSASSSLASLIGAIHLDTSGLATSGDITILAEQITSASSSLALAIPSALTSSFDTVNTGVANASSSLYALLSGLMTTNTDTITGQITNASSSLANNITDSQFALDIVIGNASTSLYSTLNASIVNASSSLASLISAITFDTSNLATIGSITDLSDQLNAASTSLAIAIPSAINPTITSASSSLASLITAAENILGGKIENASTSLASQISSSTQSGSVNNWYVAMSNVDRVLIGEKYKAKIYVTNSNSVPTNLAVAPKISLYNNNGDPVTENISMTLGTSTGSYSYSYTIPDLAEGLWEAEVKTEVESGKIITTNDYFAIEGSPAEVRINSVSDAVAVSGGLEVTAEAFIKNEGNADYEYHYEWCTVSNVNDVCRGGHDLFYGSNSKLIEVGSSTVKYLTATVPSAGNYYFKLVVYYGMEKSGASRYFTATAPVIVNPPTPPAPPGGGGGGGGEGGGVPTSCNGADFNHDKKVNSIDFSILLAFWKTAWPFKNPCVDTNNDKKVNSADFSILMYQWSKK